MGHISLCVLGICKDNYLSQSLQTVPVQGKTFTHQPSVKTQGSCKPFLGAPLLWTCLCALIPPVHAAAFKCSHFPRSLTPAASQGFRWSGTFLHPQPPTGLQTPSCCQQPDSQMRPRPLFSVVPGVRRQTPVPRAGPRQARTWQVSSTLSLPLQGRGWELGQAQPPRSLSVWRWLCLG